MLARYWQRVLSYRYDPFQTGLDGIPFIEPFPRLLPCTRCWIAAFWFALIDRHSWPD